MLMIYMLKHSKHKELHKDLMQVKKIKNQQKHLNKKLHKLLNQLLELKLQPNHLKEHQLILQQKLVKQQLKQQLIKLILLHHKKKPKAQTKMSPEPNYKLIKKLLPLKLQLENIKLKDNLNRCNINPKKSTRWQILLNLKPLKQLMKLKNLKNMHKNQIENLKLNQRTHSWLLNSRKQLITLRNQLLKQEC